MALLFNIKAYLALRQIGHDALLGYHGLKKSSFPFGYETEYDLGQRLLLTSYHVLRQNTNGQTHCRNV